MEFRLNLASRDYLDRRSVRRWLLLIGGLLGVLLAVNLLYGYRYLQQKRLVDAQLAEINSKLAAQHGRAPSTYTPSALPRLWGRSPPPTRLSTLTSSAGRPCSAVRRVASRGGGHPLP